MTELIHGKDRGPEVSRRPAHTHAPHTHALAGKGGWAPNLRLNGGQCAQVASVYSRHLATARGGEWGLVTAGGHAHITYVHVPARAHMHRYTPHTCLRVHGCLHVLLASIQNRDITTTRPQHTSLPFRSPGPTAHHDPLSISPPPQPLTHPQGPGMGLLYTFPTS